MTESEAIKEVRFNMSKIGLSDKAAKRVAEARNMAIKALEKQEKIKEAVEMWKAETGGYYSADDETTRFISTLSQIFRSDEE